MRRSALAVLACLALFAASGCALEVDTTDGDRDEWIGTEQDALQWDQAVVDEQAPVDPGSALVDGEPADDDVEPADDDEIFFAADGESDPIEHLDGSETEQEDPDPTPWQPTTRSDPSPDPWQNPDDDWTNDEHTGGGAHTDDDEARADPDPSPWHNAAVAAPMPAPEYLVFVEPAELGERLSH